MKEIIPVTDLQRQAGQIVSGLADSDSHQQVKAKLEKRAQRQSAARPRARRNRS